VPLIPEPSSYEVETAIANLQSYKSLSIVVILAEIIQAGCETLRSEVHNIINSVGIRKNGLSSGRCVLLYQFTGRATKIIVIIIEEYQCHQLHTKLYPTHFFQDCDHG
jgi:hypothetical protein